jgi:hypothetical protein
MQSTAASVYFHRALVCLIPAATLTWMAIRGSGGAALIGFALIAWGAGAYWLWRGSRRLAEESAQRRR